MLLVLLVSQVPSIRALLSYEFVMYAPFGSVMPEIKELAVFAPATPRL